MLSGGAVLHCICLALLRSASFLTYWFLPILSYSCAVWAVEPKIGEGAEVLHRQFLKQLLGVRKSTANQIVLAEFGRYPLQIHFWQQIARYHNCAVSLPDDRLVKLALLDGIYQIDSGTSRVEDLTGNWRSDVRRFLVKHPGQRAVLGQLDIQGIIERERALYISDFQTDTQHSSLQLYRTLNPHHEYADYLSTVTCYPYRRLISRFRCGCHGLHVDTGRFGKDEQMLSRGQRLCPVCLSCCTEDEHHFLFQCPAFQQTYRSFPTPIAYSGIFPCHCPTWPLGEVS